MKRKIARILDRCWIALSGVRLTQLDDGAIVLINRNRSVIKVNHATDFRDCFRFMVEPLSGWRKYFVISILAIRSHIDKKGKNGNEKR